MISNSQKRHHVCNFGPADRGYYEQTVKIAASMGLESWISVAVLPGGPDTWPQLSGFYVKCDNLSELWARVSRFMGK